MKTFTIETIRTWNPCYDPSRHLPEDWEGTAVDILKNEKIPFEDRLWVVLRIDLVSERTMRLFAVWAARQASKFVKEDERKNFNDILDVIQRFAMGEASEEERDAAWDAALDAARDAALDAAKVAARDAARAAAWDAAKVAAGVAALDAALDAARDAAKVAAGVAARDAALDAAWDAARDAALDAAWDAALDAAKVAQRDKLIEMIECEK